MLFSTDDLNPEFLDYFIEHIEPLRKQYPNFKIIAFVTPIWHNKKENDILYNSEFIDYLIKNKDWLIIAMHGWFHINNESEFPQSTVTGVMHNSKIYLDQLTKLGIATINAYKPPFYAWNSKSMIVAREEGYKYFFIANGLVDLTTFKFRPRKKLQLLDSHTNPKLDVNLEDRIDLHVFDKKLKELHGLVINYE